jgi:hypothetical protein
MLVSDREGLSTHVGIWTMRRASGSETKISKVRCDVDHPGPKKCTDDNNSKCKTNKTFITVGILANVGALVLLGIGIGPPIGVALTAAIAGFCYLVVWAIYADHINAKPENCGLKDSDFDLGGSFGCTLVAWLLCWVGAALAGMSGKAEG